MTNRLSTAATRLRQALPNLFANVSTFEPEGTRPTAEFSVVEEIEQRIKAIHGQLAASLYAHPDAVEKSARMLLQWMVQGNVVRIVGAGRARLAAAIPANRLAHGGARVHIQDDMVPMPHTIRGGGLVAASASGKTESVLSVLRSTRTYSRDIEVLGIADSSANEFRQLCDVFIGIEPAPKTIVNPLRALADSEEYVISELLDGLVVSAGKLGGFDDPYWRLGHEDLGATGPYNFGQKG